MISIDGPALAADAGLRYVGPDAAGYRRVRRGKGFAYLDEKGAAVNGRVKERIRDLVIPPAWEQVWISKDPRGHILATGHDEAGRKQYIYHPQWEEVRDEVKFDRLRPFGERLTDLRRRVDSDLRRRGLPRDKVVALAVAVLDQTLIRVGNRKYATENGSYGLTTLTCDHIEVDGRHIHFDFTGKGGSERQFVFEDRRLASLVSTCQELAGQTLFSYEAPAGRSSSVTSSDVNGYLSETMGDAFTAKDVRTWGASSVVTGELARAEAGDAEDWIREAVDVAAERLGNTRAVCRSSYIHPLVLETFIEGNLAEIWRRARPGRWTSREESALRGVLEAV